MSDVDRPFDLGVPDAPELSMSTFTLERLKVAAAGRIGAHVLASAELHEISQVQAHLFDGMCYRLTSEILAERTLDTEAKVVWSGSADVEIPAARVRWLCLLLPLAAALGLLTPLLGIGSFVAAVLVAIVGVALVAANPPRESRIVQHPISGTVTVPATYWRKFPEIDHVYPKDFGTPIRYSVLGTPYWEQDLER